jgi:hypothetical protein
LSFVEINSVIPTNKVTGPARRRSGSEHAGEFLEAFSVWQLAQIMTMFLRLPRDKLRPE